MATSLVNNKYRITRRIGGGSFGEIYLGVGPSGEKVAVKFEKHGSRCPQLRHEYKVYREVASCHGFCRVHHFGTQDNYNVMVMDLLGPSLEDLFNRCGRRFSLKTVLQLADQMLERVDTFHSRHLIHRDIKPANFVIGTGESANIVFCVDFGLSKRYRHPKNLQHIPHRDGRSLTGTPRYASINNHLGIEQSRRDDLESIAYVLVYFLKGSLPWQGLKAKNAQKKYRLILEKKQQVSIAQLCAGCPSQFGEFLAYTRALKFDTKPDIPFLRKMFRDLYHAQGCANTGKLWDWDSAEADAMIAGPPEVNTGGPMASSGGPGEIGEMGGFDAKRVQTANTGVRPAAAGGYASSGRPDSAAAETYDTKPGTTRSAGSLHRDGEGGDADPGRHQRPHTAHGGRGEEDDGHVVAGARAMMQYRRTRGDSGGAGPPAGGNAVPAVGSKTGSNGGSEGNRWASSLFDQKKASGSGSGSGSGRNPPAAVAAPNSGRKPPSSASGWPGDSRPKSAGAPGAAAAAAAPPPVRQASAGVTSGRTGTTDQSNSMSYGSLKNRFLSGSKNKSKLFGR